jgi:hypothetical protein
MAIDKQNPTQQRQQPLSLSDALSPLSTGDLGSLRVRSMRSSRRDPIAQRAFLRLMLASALEIAADVDDCLMEDVSSTDNVEQEDSRSQNQTQ